MPSKGNSFVSSNIETSVESRHQLILLLSLESNSGLCCVKNGLLRTLFSLGIEVVVMLFFFMTATPLIEPLSPHIKEYRTVKNL